MKETYRLDRLLVDAEVVETPIARRILARWRDGDPTYGLNLGFDAAGRSFRPRLSLGLSGFVQGDALSVRSRLSLAWRIPVAWWFALYPWVAGRAVHVAPVSKIYPDFEAPDPDDPEDEAYFGDPIPDNDGAIYTNYDAQHPYFGRFGLACYSRPLRDVALSMGIEGRTNADFASLDRLDGVFRLRYMPGWSLLPAAAASYRVSQRFSDEDRGESYVQGRLRIELDVAQVWLGSSLFVLGGQMDVVQNPSLFAGFVSLRYFYTANRGLRDLNERQLRHRVQHGPVVAPASF